MQKILHLNWRLQVIIGFLILVMIFGISRLFQPSTPSQNPLPPPMAVPTSYPTTNQWQTYKTDSYTFTYPSDWKQEVYTTNTGEQTVVVRPVDATTYYPSFSISAIQRSPQEFLQTEVQILKGFGLSQNVATISGISGTQMTGTSKIQVIEGKVVKSPAQETHLYIQKGSTLYDIGYKYAGAKNKNEEEVFNKIVQSLQFVK